MASRRFLSLFLLVTLSACGHPRPAPLSSIAVPAIMITATPHGAPPRDPGELGNLARKAFGATTPGGRTMVSANCALPELAAPPAHAPGTAHYLVLSGGSLNGAFGAGFFLGLQDKALLPPEADVVTGVSTGALQSTFLFLARDSLPANDRDYGWVAGAATQSLPGADNAPALRPGRSDIEDLALAYSIDRERRILKATPFGGIGMLLRGSRGTLDPLRDRLMALITPNTIRAVAIEACRGRKLFVGVTNVDDGFGYALDLTDLALRAYDATAPTSTTATRMTAIRQAYVESLIASSSVPVGAKPVRLQICLDQCEVPRPEHRTNLFVDGGARFGVFLREIGDAEAQAKTSAAQPGASDITLIVNTRLSLDPWHAGSLLNPDDEWMLTTLGLRTVEILENQVYQLSVAAIENRASALRMAYISNENIAPGTRGSELPDAHLYQDRTCAAWEHDDGEKHDPVQFYPTYMACLLDYGRERGALGLWNYTARR